MTNWGRALKRGVQAFSESLGPGEYTAAGKKIVCGHCGAGEFVKGSALLNSSGMTFASLDWADRSATTLACTNCGKIQWFLREPQRAE